MEDIDLDKINKEENSIWNLVVVKYVT
jgi:hypothetical protein